MKRLTAWKPSGLDNKHDENADTYTHIEELTDEVYDSLKQLDGEPVTEATSTVLENVVDKLDVASDNVSECKQMGIHNEDQLGYGRERINELTDKVSELEDELNSVEDETVDLRNSVAGVRRSVNAVRHTFICHVNDELKEVIDAEAEYIRDVRSKLTVGDEESRQAVVDIVDHYDGTYSDIYSLISEARGMNDRMGDGLDEDDRDIDKLENRVTELVDQIDILRAEIDELK